MREIKILSFAKINLSIDVVGKLEAGMHEVDMIMQQLSFHDDVHIRYTRNKNPKQAEKLQIILKTNRPYLPTDERNLAFKAAVLMAEKYGFMMKGGMLEIDIHKRIPVAAGLAGGSGNGAAVLHGLNVLWHLKLSLRNLCDLAEELGSDVPFCLLGQAGHNYNLPKSIRKDSYALSCARATGTGVTLTPVKPISKAFIIAKPPMGVSTAEVYKAIDNCEIKNRPNNELLISGLEKKDEKLIYSNCINVLEEYTLKAYPKVLQLKRLVESDSKVEKVLMSGSGPTVFGCFSNISDAKEACRVIRENGYECYWTRSTR